LIRPGSKAKNSEPALATKADKQATFDWDRFERLAGEIKKYDCRGDDVADTHDETKFFRNWACPASNVTVRDVKSMSVNFGLRQFATSCSQFRIANNF